MVCKDSSRDDDQERGEIRTYTGDLIDRGLSK